MDENYQPITVLPIYKVAAGQSIQSIGDVSFVLERPQAVEIEMPAITDKSKKAYNFRMVCKADVRR
jgi:hypothetical protein